MDGQREKSSLSLPFLIDPLAFHRSRSLTASVRERRSFSLETRDGRSTGKR